MSDGLLTAISCRGAPGLPLRDKLICPDMTNAAIAIGCAGAFAGYWLACSGRIDHLVPPRRQPTPSRQQQMAQPAPMATSPLRDPVRPSIVGWIAIGFTVVTVAYTLVFVAAPAYIAALRDWIGSILTTGRMP